MLVAEMNKQIPPREQTRGPKITSSDLASKYQTLVRVPTPTEIVARSGERHEIFMYRHGRIHIVDICHRASYARFYHRHLLAGTRVQGRKLCDESFTLEIFCELIFFFFSSLSELGKDCQESVLAR